MDELLAGLNYHHLRYFWAAVKEGGVSRAAASLNVAQPSLSAQIHQLEEALGEKLFARQGRTLTPTEIGRLVYRYADEIFSLGREMVDAVQDRPGGRIQRLNVGIANVVPKRVAYRLLEPALRLPEPLRLECREDQPERLLAELALHRLDVVILDAPAPPTVRVHAYSHLLGESGVTLMASAELAKAHRRRFPRSLDGAPLLVPTEATLLRRSLDAWLDREGLRPRIVGEFDDTALLKAFGEAGTGLFPVPTVIEKDVRRQYRVQVVGRLSALRERFYAITVQRRIQHPGVVAISKAGRGLLA
jgi:LysR family transcriptional activator of nhaA